MAEKMRFEDAVKRLNEILDTLENRNSGLEETVTLYEEGMKLLHKCNSMLDKAEQKVEMLKNSYDQEPVTVPFQGVFEDG